MRGLVYMGSVIKWKGLVSRKDSIFKKVII